MFSGWDGSEGLSPVGQMFSTTDEVLAPALSRINKLSGVYRHLHTATSALETLWLSIVQILFNKILFLLILV